MNYYRDMWERRSHVLAPLTKIMSTKVKFKWTKIEQYDFDIIKRIVAPDTLLTYPNFNKTFKIHTDDSNSQLGAIISQKGTPIALYIRKLTVHQKRYKIKYKDMLSIVVSLK